MKNMRALFIVVAFLLLSSYAFSDVFDQISPQANHPKAAWRSLQKGMTQDEVRQILGEPDKIENDYTDDPIWTYHYGTNGIPIYFGNVKFGTIGPLWNQKKRVVIGWQEPD